jgi:hypothetical protein
MVRLGIKQAKNIKIGIPARKKPSANKPPESVWIFPVPINIKMVRMGVA